MEEEAAAAKEKPLTTVERSGGFLKNAEYFSEEVRREINDDFGEEALYEGGLIVRTTLDPKLQNIATRVFHDEIMNYDRRHGWRGAVANIPLEKGWEEALSKVEMPGGADENWEKAVVLEVKPDKALIETSAKEKGEFRCRCWAGRAGTCPRLRTSAALRKPFPMFCMSVTSFLPKRFPKKRPKRKNCRKILTNCVRCPMSKAR